MKPAPLTREREQGALFLLKFLDAIRVGVKLLAEATQFKSAPGEGHKHPRWLLYKFAGCSAWQVSTMILPQVHLRKPCYDFSFL